jgi:8-oxo-dGTP pyrophosphatase MutT (NUDIX family)
MEKHFCTMVYVYNPRTDKFLLVKHKKLGKWIQPGGHIDTNEDPEEAAIREVLEETGLNVRLIGERPEGCYTLPLALQKNLFKSDPNHIHMDFVYIAIPEDEELRLNEQESDGLEWFTIDEIKDPSFSTFSDVPVWCEKARKFYQDTYSS